MTNKERLDNYVKEAIETNMLEQEQVEFILYLQNCYEESETELGSYNLEEIIATMKSVINLSILN